MRILTVEETVQQIISKRRQISLRERALLVGISGIDGCGKGYITKQVVPLLNSTLQSCVAISVDGWLNLPEKRFSSQHPARHFYDHAIRFDEMFSQFILPLQQNKSIDLVADFAAETAIEYKRYRYQYEGVEVILLEGIYLFKRAFRHYFDIAIWIECTLDTALQRAVSRGQEGLPPEQTIDAYRRIYFPGQQIHFELDHPRESADFAIFND